MNFPKLTFKKPFTNFGKNIGKGLKHMDNSDAGTGLGTLLNQGTETMKPTLKSGLTKVGNTIKEPFIYAWTESGIGDKIVSAWNDHIKEPMGLSTDAVKDSFGKAVDNLNVPFLSKKDVENGVDLEKFKDMQSLLDIQGLNPTDFLPENFDAMSLAKKQGVDTSSATNPVLNKPSIKDITSGNFEGIKISNLNAKGDLVSSTMETINSKTSAFNDVVKSNSDMFDLSNSFDTNNMLKAFENTDSEKNKLINNPFHNAFNFNNIVDPDKMSYFESLQNGGDKIEVLKLADRSRLEQYAIQPGIDKIPVEKYDASMYADFPIIDQMHGKLDGESDINRYTIFDYHEEDLLSGMDAQLKSFNDISQYNPFVKMEQMDIFYDTDAVNKGLDYYNEGHSLMEKDLKNLDSVFDTGSNPFFSKGYKPLKEVYSIDQNSFKSIIKKTVSLFKL